MTCRFNQYREDDETCRNCGRTAIEIFVDDFSSQEFVEHCQELNIVDEKNPNQLKMTCRCDMYRREDEEACPNCGRTAIEIFENDFSNQEFVEQFTMCLVVINFIENH